MEESCWFLSCDMNSLILNVYIRMKIPIVEYTPGIFLFITWVIFGLFIDFGVKQRFVNLAFIFLSFFNSFMYFNKTTTRQLFYSGDHVLLRSSHAHKRRVTSGGPRTLRSIIGDFLRGQSKSKEIQGRDHLDIIEIDIWTMNPYTEGIFIFLSPITTILPILSQKKIQVLVFAIAFSIFMVYFLHSVHLAIEDQKIIGEELFRTQSNSVNNKLVENAYYDYSNRVYKRKASYQTQMPEHGPGSDMRHYMNIQTVQRNDSDYSEYESESSSNATPISLSKHSESWYDKIRKASID